MSGALAARRARPARRPAHRLTTAHVQAAYPFVAADGLGSRGTYIGTDAHGAAFTYCPFELYGRAITSPNMAVFGQLGTAKSSLVKTLALRGIPFGHRAWVTDPKGEYQRLCELLGVEPIALHPGGPVRLNPITPLAGERAQIGLLVAVTAAMLDRPLRPVEEAALGEALARVSEDNGLTNEPTIPQVVDAMLAPDVPTAQRMAFDRERLVDESRDAALALRALCEGELAGMFDAPTTPSLDLEAQLVVFDLSRVRSSRALGILMACTNAFQWAVIRRMHEAAAAAGRRSPKVKRINDEGWTSPASTSRSRSRRSSLASTACRTSTSSTAPRTWVPWATPAPAVHASSRDSWRTSRRGSSTGCPKARSSCRGTCSRSTTPRPRSYRRSAAVRRCGRSASGRSSSRTG